MLVRRNPSGQIQDLTPPPYNVRTRVHEYGGGEYTVHGGTVYFSNDSDQRLYRLEGAGEPRPITREPDSPGALRYADGRVTPDGEYLVCVMETHGPEGEPSNHLVLLATDGSGGPVPLVTDHDFCSSPRISPDGRRLAWLVWDHPRMPW